MTGPSGACRTCKTRRVKCDETKPVCQRCAKSRRVCITAAAAPKQPSFSIHLENDYASGQNKRPRGPRSNLTVRPSPVDLETKALAYYFQFQLQPVPDAPLAVGDLQECVEEWTRSGRQDHMVDLALSSMALAVYSRTQNDLQAGTEASSRYHDLLSIVHDRIEKVELPNLSEQDIDACLLTIFFMGRLEGVMHQAPVVNAKFALDEMRSFLHHNGALAVLKVWNDKLSQTTAASAIVRQTRRGQIRSAIMRNRTLPDWIHDGSRFGEQGFDLEYDFILIQTVVLRESLTALQKMDDDEVDNELVKALGTEGLNIDRTLQDLTARMTHNCQPIEHTLPASEHVPTKHFYSRKLLLFSQPAHAVVWTQLLGTRMLLKSTLIGIVALAHPTLLNWATWSMKRTDCERDLSLLANELASCIPFCLDKVKSVDLENPGSRSSSSSSYTINRDKIMQPFLTAGLVWVLTVAAALKHVDAEQQRWFRSELAHAGSVIGDRNISRADTDQWELAI